MFFDFLSRIFGSCLFRGYLDEGEKIIFVAHKHIWTHYRPLLKKIFFAEMIPLSIWFLFPDSKMVMLIWMLIGGLFVIYELLDWYYDALLITDLSLLIVEWNGFFSNSSSRIDYGTIEGVSWSKKGFAQTVLAFGDVEVSKIGSGDAFVIKNASNPKTVEREILKQQNVVIQRNSFKNSETLKNLLVDMINNHHLRQ